MKHAYLIMAHHRPDLLRELLNSIDDKRNDIFIHIDAKSKLHFDNNTRYSNCYSVTPINVNWGGYSQIVATYKLLKAARMNDSYQYYHFLTGSTFPLKNQDDMHEFFDSFNGKEFIGFAGKHGEKSTIDRVRYHFLFSESGIKDGVRAKILYGVQKSYNQIQSLLGVNLFKKYGMVYKKGIAYWSITEDFARYLIENEKIVEQMLCNSICGDEVFVQTLAYNSDFRNRIYSLSDEWEGSMREIAWEHFGCRPGHNFKYDDLNFLLMSNKCFALKFEGPDGMRIIDGLKNKLY